MTRLASSGDAPPLIVPHDAVVPSVVKYLPELPDCAGAATTVRRPGHDMESTEPVWNVENCRVIVVVPAESLTVLTGRSYDTPPTTVLRTVPAEMPVRLAV